MKQTTTYQKHELCKGKCKSCGDVGDRLCLETMFADDKENHMCPDCIEAIKFEKGG